MKEKGGLDLEQRFCRRCLLKEMDADAYFSNVYEYIASLSEDERAPEELYEQRLGYCRACDHLINGMCALCGCFVEVRAAKRISRCADTPRRW